MEDAGIYELDADTLLVQTLDFITPVLDDPYSFGQAAAANALSDIYAMGALPLTAMNIVAFPATLAGRSATEVLAAILRGGRDKVAEAGASIIGGHSVEDAEPKYGLAVTGVARRPELLLQSAGRPGDVLFLTKPIGGGVLSTALKRQGLPPDILAELTQVLTTLNAFGRDAALGAGVRAATDVTGFGLLGHLSNLMLASGVGAEIEAERVPLITGAAAFAAQGFFPSGARRNLEFVSQRVSLEFRGQVGSRPDTSWRRLVLADPLTSGGLLVAVPADGADTFARLVAAGLATLKGAPPTWCSPIGRLTHDAGHLSVRF